MSVVRATVRGVNRTDRLYGIVEDLRAAAPLRRSARQLAARYEVSVRTIERDISALQQVGVPIYADTGRRGGYAIDPSIAHNLHHVSERILGRPSSDPLRSSASLDLREPRHSGHPAYCAGQGHSRAMPTRA